MNRPEWEGFKLGHTQYTDNYEKALHDFIAATKAFKQYVLDNAVKNSGIQLNNLNITNAAEAITFVNILKIIAENYITEAYPGHLYEYHNFDIKPNGDINMTITYSTQTMIDFKLENVLSWDDIIIVGDKFTLKN